MKKTVSIILVLAVSLLLAACAKQAASEQTESEQEASEQTEAKQEATEQTTPDADWNIPETTEMTAEVTELFDKAMEGLGGVDYEPAGFLAEKDGVYCVLCRAVGVYPDAKPYYALVYFNDQGIQNIWDIWMGAHAQKKD